MLALFGCQSLDYGHSSVSDRDREWCNLKCFTLGMFVDVTMKRNGDPKVVNKVMWMKDDIGHRI